MNTTFCFLIQVLVRLSDRSFETTKTILMKALVKMICTTMYSLSEGYRPLNCKQSSLHPSKSSQPRVRFTFECVLPQATSDKAKCRFLGRPGTCKRFGIRPALFISTIRAILPACICHIVRCTWRHFNEHSRGSRIVVRRPLTSLRRFGGLPPAANGPALIFPHVHALIVHLFEAYLQ